MIRTLFIPGVLTAGLATSGLFLFVSNKPQTSSKPVPAQAIVTVEAPAYSRRRSSSASTGDVIASEHRVRLPVTELVPQQGC